MWLRSKHDEGGRVDYGRCINEGSEVKDGCGKTRLTES
jgi:hypothetical protein